MKNTKTDEKTIPSVRQAQPDPNKAFLPPSAAAEPAAPRPRQTTRPRQTATPPASKIPPQSAQKTGGAWGVLLLVLLPLLLWQLLASAGYLPMGLDAVARLVLVQFNALEGGTILRFWEHLAEIAVCLVLPPLLAGLAAAALFRQRSSIADQAAGALHTVGGLLTLCGVILCGVVKAFIHPPKEAEPEKPEAAPPEEVFEDPLFPDNLPEDIRRAMGTAGETKIKK